MSPDEVGAWFVAEILPHEPQLMRFLLVNWRGADEVDDLRQDIYARVFDAAGTRRPDNPRAFLFSVARNLIIDRVRRGRVVSIESYAELETVAHMVDERSPERHLASWSELKRLRLALQTLPPRCQEVVRLRKIEGFSQREVATRMGITEDTVERQMTKGIRLLANAYLEAGDDGARIQPSGPASDQSTRNTRNDG